MALRRVPPGLLDATQAFLAGDSDALLSRLFGHLLESRHARLQAVDVEEALHRLGAFYRGDVVGLREALRAAGREGSFVPREGRDALFIEARLAKLRAGV